MKRISNLFRKLITQVRTINREYAVPQIEMTPFTKVCLFGLRLYLFALIGLMIFKFITVVK